MTAEKIRVGKVEVELMYVPRIEEKQEPYKTESLIWLSNRFK